VPVVGLVGVCGGRRPFTGWAGIYGKSTTAYQPESVATDGNPIGGPDPYPTRRRSAYYPESVATGGNPIADQDG
jgi:hypothetical protein